MGATVLTELYRFDEKNGTYSAFTNLVFYGDECIIVGLLTFNIAMRKELFAYLRTRGVLWIRFTHKKKNRIIRLTK